MIKDEELKRINELARKKKTTGLSPAELEEQQALRKKYIEAVKASLRSNLDRIEFVDEK